MLRAAAVICFALALLVPGIGRAALITDAPSGGVVTTFPGGSGIFSGSGTDTVAGFPIAWTGDVVFDYSDGFGMGTNGDWEWSMIGIDSSSDSSITINLGGLYSAVGGFMNYSPGGEFSPTISAIAADGTTILESYMLDLDAPISTPGETNGGAFRGIERAQGDIAYFRIENSYLGMHDITLLGGTPSEVPEPSTLMLTFAAGSLLWLWRRRTA